MTLKISSYFLCASLLFILSSCTTDPVIGVMTLPDNSHPGRNYISTSYVKWVESGGARVVPIQYDTPKEELDVLFEGINGLLFTGGDSVLSGTDRYLFQRAIEANKGGDFFPVWGTCLGFEFLMELVSGKDSILSSGYDAMELMIPVNLTTTAHYSRMSAGIGADVMKYLESEPISVNMHSQGVSLVDFEANSDLKQFFALLATNYDRGGREFVSMVEAVNFPIYATQFHPEKTVYEWMSDMKVPHSAHAVEMAFAMAKFFVDEARKSPHAFENPRELDARVIYNFKTTFTGAEGSEFDEKYFFDAPL